MKSLVYTAPNEVAYRDEPDAGHAHGEVLIRVEAVGICGSDMRAYHGPDPRRNPPLIRGHELAGTIVAGPGAGGRVTVNALRRRSLENATDARVYDGARHERIRTRRRRRRHEDRFATMKRSPRPGAARGRGRTAHR